MNTEADHPRAPSHPPTRLPPIRIHSWHGVQAAAFGNKPLAQKLCSDPALQACCQTPPTTHQRRQGRQRSAIAGANEMQAKAAPRKTLSKLPPKLLRPPQGSDILTIAKPCESPERFHPRPDWNTVCLPGARERANTSSTGLLSICARPQSLLYLL